MTRAFSGHPFRENLFERVLLDPAARGGVELFAISGYASPAMIVRHFDGLSGLGRPIAIDLQVGMSGKDGVPRSAVAGYRTVNRQVVHGRIRCRFNTGAPIHANMYVWCTEQGPSQAFMGSGNYTQSGFNIAGESLWQEEVFVEIDPVSAFDYVVEVSGNSVLIEDPDFEKLVVLTDELVPGEETSGGLEIRGMDPASRTSYLLPIVQTTKSPGEVHNPGAGLNWGQRGNRNPDEAYIPVPSRVRDAGFFPERGVKFQVVTDDGDSFVATVAQQGQKALETPEDNSLFGSYFRRRLGLRPGQVITTKNLDDFGSNAVRLVKISDDLYQMVFEAGLNYFQEKDEP